MMMNARPRVRQYGVNQMTKEQLKIFAAGFRRIKQLQMLHGGDAEHPEVVLAIKHLNDFATRMKKLYGIDMYQAFLRWKAAQ
jgi:hypothetical protein